MTEHIIPLITLIALELVLGIDNIIFISILTEKLPLNQQNKLRYWGLGLAVVMRLFLLTGISYILKLNKTLFEFLEIPISGKDIILIVGGLFLIYKSVKELYAKSQNNEATTSTVEKKASFNTLLLDIILLDLVFSVDSIITAVGMVSELWIMYTAVIVSVLIMLVAAKPISNFIQKYPSLKILALAFLIFIGVALIAEGFHSEIPKGYIYCSMLFSLVVNLVQIKTQSFKNNMNGNR